MKRLLNPEMVLGFLIGAVLWIAVLGWQTSYAPTDSEKRQCEESATKSGHKAEDCKTLWEKTTSDPVAFFTFWLVVFTGGLGVSTVMLWLAGERQIELARETSVAQSRDMEASIVAAQRAADAAHLNAESVINSERAFLFLQVQDNNFDQMVAGAALLDADDSYTTGAIRVRYAFRNYGRTAAIIKEVCHRLVHQVSLPKVPEYDPISPLLIEHIVAQNEVSQSLHCAIESVINVKDAKSIARGDSTLWLYGYVAYDDAFGWGRELRYIWHFNGDSGGFRLYSYREHEAKHAKR